MLRNLEYYSKVQFTHVHIEMKLTQGRDWKQSLVFEIRKIWEHLLMCVIILMVFPLVIVTMLIARVLIEYLYKRYGVLYYSF